MAKFLPLYVTEREIMSEVELDSMSNWIQMLKQLKLDKSQVMEEIEVIETQIKDVMGEAEVGTIGGEPIVRWTHIVSKRFSQKRANLVLSGEQYSQCMEETSSRRFTIVDV